MTSANPTTEQINRGQIGQPAAWMIESNGRLCVFPVESEPGRDPVYPVAGHWHRIIASAASLKP
jgi:hypothetical protein